MASPDKDKEGGFRWSFDEIRNIFVRGSAKSAERGSSTGSFHWSFSGTLEAIRSRFSSHEQHTSADGESGAKRARMLEEEAPDKETRRENRRQARKGKSEKERDRRNNVNGLFSTLGGLLGMEAGVKNKSAILSNAKEFIQQTNEGSPPATVDSGDL